MSRAYRIQLSESIRRRVVVGDRVQAGLNLLDVLPREQMAALLAAALEARGFEAQEDGRLIRVEDDGVEVVVDPVAGTVTLQREVARDHQASAERDLRVVDENAKAREKAGRDALRRDLEQQIDEAAEAERKVITEQLERRLGDLQAELDQVVNEVVGAALKRRAAQLGEVTEIHEDAATGSLTIKVKL